MGFFPTSRFPCLLSCRSVSSQPNRWSFYEQSKARGLAQWCFLWLCRWTFRSRTLWADTTSVPPFSWTSRCRFALTSPSRGEGPSQQQSWPGPPSLPPSLPRKAQAGKVWGPLLVQGLSPLESGPSLHPQILFFSHSPIFGYPSKNKEQTLSCADSWGPGANGMTGIQAGIQPWKKVAFFVKSVGSSPFLKKERKMISMSAPAGSRP